jgi:hypothetical protein
VSFLSPLFLIGAAAAAIPIVLHLLHRRVEPIVDFAAMRYLRVAPVEESKRRRVRELVLLALRVAALVLLACAFAQPYFTGGFAAAGEGTTLVLVDVSASLSAPGQFDAALQRAAEVIRQAPATDAVGVLSFAQASSVNAPVSHDRTGALAAVGQLTPGAGATRYHSALRQAAETLKGRSGRMVVVTDLQRTGWDADPGEGGIPASLALEVEDIGGPSANLAVSDLRVEGTDAVAVVRNFSSRQVTEQVIFSIDDRRIGSAVLTLAPGGSAEARLSTAGYQSGALAASIADPDGYLADNIRYAALDAGDATSVVAVTATGHPSDAIYLDRALGIAEGAGGFRFRAADGATVSSPDADVFDGAHAVVLMSTRGLEQRGRARLAAFVRAGGGLLLTSGPEVDPAIVRQALNGIVLTSWTVRPDASVSFAAEDSRHPIFRVFGGLGTLGGVSFSRAARIAVAEGADVLARYSDGSPALVEERTTGGRVLVFGSDVNNRWNNLPLQPAFVPFIHESLRYLASPRARRSAYLVGELQGNAGLTPGVIELQGRRVAVNTDPRESDPTRMSADAFQTGVPRFDGSGAPPAGRAAGPQERGHGLWWYGLLLVLVTLTMEGVLGRRLR